MGLVGGDGVSIAFGDIFDREVQFHTDIDVRFKMIGETDNGLTFGAFIDLDEGGAGSDAHADDAEHGGATMFVSGSFGTVTMGDTDGALDWALREAVLGDSIDDLEEHIGWAGNSGLDGSYDGQILRYEYAWETFATALSVETDDFGDTDPVIGLGGRYTWNFASGDITIGAGYQKADFSRNSSAGADIWGISLDADLYNGIRAVVNYSVYDAYDHGFSTYDWGEDSIGLALAYELDEWLVSLNWGQRDTNYDRVSPSSTTSEDDRYEGLSLVVNYDLGGGAVIQGGVAKGKVSESGVFTSVSGTFPYQFEDDYLKWSLGIAMSF